MMIDENVDDNSDDDDDDDDDDNSDDDDDDDDDNSDELEDCLRYKSFLDMLTPTEWFEQHQQRHQEKVDKIKQDSFRAKHKEWDRLRRKLIEGE